jgi:hypothetical protein
VRKNILAVVFLAICPLAFAQQALNNDAIIKLVKAGMSDDLIITTINAQPGNFDVSTDGLIALKTGGASDKVVSAIVLKASAAPQPPPVAPAPPAPPVAPAPPAPPVTPTPPAPPVVPTPPAPPVAPTPPAPPVPDATALPPGIDVVGVYYQDQSGAWKLILPEIVTARLGGFEINPLHPKDTGSRSTNGHLAGPKSATAATLPVMLAVYVPEGRTIADYRLLRLQVKSNERVFPISSGTATTENDELDKTAVGFSSEKIAPRVYQIQLSAHLGKSEYGMLAPKPRDASEGNNWKIYCVSVSE